MFRIDDNVSAARINIKILSTLLAEGFRRFAKPNLGKTPFNHHDTISVSRPCSISIFSVKLTARKINLTL